VQIHVKDCLGIGEKENAFTSEIFPNPNNGAFSLNINSHAKENIDLRLVNELNILIFQEQDWVVSGKMQRSFDFRKLPAGVYFLELDRKEGKLTHKIVIRR
jgi:hypothetical protein